MEEQETDKLKLGSWSCKLCTYKNVSSQLRCELCGTTRYSSQASSETDAIKAQADMLSRRWSCGICTFDNIQGATKCVKCDADKDASPIIHPIIHQSSWSKTATRCDSPKIESSSGLTAQILPKTTEIVSSNEDSDLIPTSSSYKWKCLTCTYLNFAAAIKCSMCRSPCHLPNKGSLSTRLPKELYKPVVPTPQIHQDGRSFMIMGSLSRFMNFYIGQNNHEDLFFRAIGSIISKHANAINVVVNYLINDGNVERALNHFEAIIVYDYASNPVPVMCGDTLLSLARRSGLTDVQKILERVSISEDNLPCAAAAPNSELYNRIYHIFNFCRPPYKIPFRAYNFNIFKLPFPKTDFTNYLLSEVFQSNFDPVMKQCLVRYVQVAAPTISQPDVRNCTVLACPSTLVIRNRGAQHSLYDAIMQSMFGVCDRTNVLRDQLQDHMNSNACLYKSRFIRQYQMMASRLGIQISDFELDDLWLSCVNGTTNQSYPPESIHIFALAHLISRPILILPFSMPVELTKRPRNLQSLASSRTNSYHIIEGFYVPYFAKNEIYTRSPICLLHNNGNFYTWVTNDEFVENCQNYLILSYPRNQLLQMFRFLEDDCDEKQLRGFLNLIQLAPNSVAIQHANQEDTITEVTSYYFDYLNAAEKALRFNQHARIVDIMRQMSVANLPNSPNVLKLFSHRAKRVLSRRPVNYNGSDHEEDENVRLVYDADETATKVSKK